jgi:hypothetical protein
MPFEPRGVYGANSRPLTLIGPAGATVRYVSNLTRRRLERLAPPPSLDQWPWLDTSVLNPSEPPTVMVVDNSRYYFWIDGAGVAPQGMVKFIDAGLEPFDIPVR